jgi:hypothetical protein
MSDKPNNERVPWVTIILVILALTYFGAVINGMLPLPF